MADISLMPIAGINNVAEDAALQRAGEDARLYVRDAVNVDLSPAGKVDLRPHPRRVTAIQYRNLWQSPLHGDVFATLGDQWGRLDTSSWTHEPLATIGEAQVSHTVLNNLVCAAGEAGIFTFDGAKAQRLTLDTPPPPLVISGEGSLEAGAYGVAVAWLRGALESAPSAIATSHVQDGGALEITLPLCLDPSVTGARLYLTQPNGGELAREQDYPVGSPTIMVRVMPQLGAPAQFQHRSPMPSGSCLAYWRGRLLTASRNLLRFSEALAYHLHDERHGFVQMPQRITFVQPVEGGIWIGQVDHVTFLAGSSPDQLVMVRKASRAPIPGSAIAVEADTLSADLSPGGAGAAMWLAENGYVAGTADGRLVELHAGMIRGVSGQSGSSVVLDRRVLTAVV